MTRSVERDQIVFTRLKSWLDGDREGVRRAILMILLRRTDLTIDDIHQHLALRFETSYHSVGGMVGIISSRIGILQATRDGEKGCRRYRLRERDLATVRRLLTS